MPLKTRDGVTIRRGSDYFDITDPDKPARKTVAYTSGNVVEIFEPGLGSIRVIPENLISVSSRPDVKIGDTVRVLRGLNSNNNDAGVIGEVSHIIAIGVNDPLRIRVKKSNGALIDADRWYIEDTKSKTKKSSKKKSDIDLSEYVKKEDVIALARKVADEQGWCDDGVREALAEIDIDIAPQKVKATITLEIDCEFEVTSEGADKFNMKYGVLEGDDANIVSLWYSEFSLYFKDRLVNNDSASFDSERVVKVEYEVV